MPRKADEKPANKPDQAERRHMRLAEALRANLKRRKAVKTKPSEKPDTAGD